MARKASPEGITRTQVLFPTPHKEWLEAEACQRDAVSKSKGGRAVKISHLVTNAIAFYRANTALVDAWIRDRGAIDLPEKRAGGGLQFDGGSRKVSTRDEVAADADRR